MKKYKVVNKNRFVLSIVVVLLIVISTILLYKQIINDKNINQQYKNEEINKINLILNKINRLDYFPKENKQQSNVKVKEYKFEEKDFIITFYDLSVESCNKKPTHKLYGVSRSGFNLRDKSWENTKVIAVDKSIIPLGSLVYIKFNNEKYGKFDDIYLAVDTGSKIKKNRIDLFLGENKTKECMDLGITKAKIVIIRKGEI